MAPQELGEAVSHRGPLLHLFIFYGTPICEKSTLWECGTKMIILGTTQ